MDFTRKDHTIELSGPLNDKKVLKNTVLSFLLALRSHDSQNFFVSELGGPDCQLGWFYSKIMRI